MKCPHCFTSVNQTTDVCAHCGFSAAAIQDYLGADWVRLERITDHSQRLNLRDTRQLETLLDDFERHFPQCFLAAYVGPLPPALTVTDLGFWLINHGAFQTHQISRRNDFGIVIVLDPLHQQAGATVGYALEPVLTPSLLSAILEKMRAPLQKSDFAGALEMAVRQVDGVLRKAGSRQPHTHQQPPPTVADASDLGFQSLRPAAPQLPGPPLKPRAPHGTRPLQ